ncbi:MAG: ATP-binding protein [Myxococcota bacterium]|nr:ATP-binding protein [Myxococcota bacterium]
MRWSEPPLGDPHRDVTGALHDVSNALTVLLGWVAEARAGRGAPEQLDRALTIVEERARTARDLARRAIGAPSTIDDRDDALDKVVDDVVEALSVEAHRADVSLVVATRSPGVRIPLAGDASEILTNLMLNALAWAPHGSRITVELQVDSTSLLLFVQDEGPGVPAGQAGRIFGGATGREGGAGVGLRHARALARAAGGDLDLLMGGPSRGARFRLRWPRIAATIPRAPLSAARPATLAGMHVLVVEDDREVAALLESALDARGAHVVVARTLDELRQHAVQRHDVALIDLSPIAHDVLGAVEELRRGSPEVALVFISGSAVGLPAGLDARQIGWVRKPFEVAEIVDAITEARDRLNSARASK